ncbi:Transient receptor potential cation channel subfamily A member 1-like 12 [Homarus americanus]|uniref:Transient receptor potential cation channel subfamily A member 1-like 12 n=1 Tax=Homarus americanus TaxID=6706 RepID=A0A8J5NC37_HOMAM|nr:Transient receptor potential cation channel subfamily A member 1-like 12 [Homarus americanus]
MIPPPPPPPVGGSVVSPMSLDPFSSYKINDLNSFSMNDQRWTLQRKKIGLKRRTKGAQERRVKSRQTQDINLSFMHSNFTRKECIRWCWVLQDGTLMNIQEKVDRKQQHKTSGLANNIFNTLSSLTRGNSVQLSSVAETSSRPPTATSKLSLQELETGVGQGEDNSVFSRENILLANGVTSRSRCNVIQPSSRPNTLPRIVMPAPDSPWRQDTHLYELPTNAYGSITFMNETAGSNKPSKYVRLSSTSNVKNVLTLLTDYWCLMDPNRPQLVISVTGGAKNFQLDGKKKEIFSSGLIKAVKSTNAWLLTGGMHVGIMKSVGEAVNRGQFIVKIKRKNFFSEERVHMIRGIRCLGVLPWGYIKNRESLMNSDVNQFTSVKTRLEEGIRKPEPEGLGVPVVLLLLDGGVNSIIKCNLALKRDIPIVVVAGTGRAADLLAYAVSMTIHTPSFQVIDKNVLIDNSHYTGEDVTSMQDQLSLALLWDRPDIAECEIFPAQKNWPSGALEDLMTTALLEEKVEFVKLFTMNGLVMADYLTVKKLRHLYNEACIPNSHLMRLLQRASQNNYHYLFHVHNVLQAMMRRHHDDIYTSDTPQAQSDNPSINYLTFEDPYMELLLWAIFSRRAWLANYLWQRCNSPLCAAIAASCLYQSLWRSLGAKNTDILEEYNKNKNTFELFAVNLLGVCYQQDVINALGLVERRNAKWGNSDCLELAVMANDLIFISTPAAQASVELNWRRGMSRAPFFAVMIANVFPLLIFWPRFFRFQKLGDNGGELTIPQKMVVFYKSPISKFCAHSTAFVIFLIVYAYVVLFDFKYEMSITEKFLFVWICIYVIDEISEIISEQSLTLRGKISDWAGSVWNRFDIVAFFLAFLALGLRLHRQTFKWGRIAYAVNTNVFYCRLFRMYHVNYHLGPKLVIFYRMISEVLVFLALLVIFILGYGIASQALLHPSRDAGSLNSTSVSSIMEDVLLTPYWQMYGELLLDEAEGDDQEVCHQKSCLINEFCTNATTTCKEKVSCVCESSKDYSWVVNLMLFFYLIIGNIMLLNLLIAIFTKRDTTHPQPLYSYVFDEVQENSMEIWKFEMLRLIREYDMKPSLIPPFVVLEYIWRVSKGTWKLFCRKHRENLEDYMKSTLDSLRIFEKEAISTYLVRITLDEECSLSRYQLENGYNCAIIDKITKYIEQKGEMEEIEEDLEWIIHETDGLKQNKGQSILLTNQSSEQQNTNIEKLISIQHQKHPTDGVQGRSRVEVMMDGDDESNQEDENELEDPPAQEVSNKDIEKEIKLLQAKVIGGRPYSSRSCAGTPSIAHRRNMDHLAGLTTRLDDLHEQLHLSQTTFNTMMKTIMARLDSIEGKI